MQKINLRELYPAVYKTDTYLEVTDEVQAVFLADKRAEALYMRQMYNYKAQYSLDCDNGIEKAVVQTPPTPEEILENKQLRHQLYTAVIELPDKQAKWIYARFYLGMTVKEIAQAESIDPSWIYKSIKQGLKRLSKKLKKFNLHGQKIVVFFTTIRRTIFHLHWYIDNLIDGISGTRTMYERIRRAAKKDKPRR